MTGTKQDILQQNKELTLTCEKGIFVPETHNILFVPQTIGIGNIAMGNQIVAKLSMYCKNCHHTNHNMETCKSKIK